MKKRINRPKKNLDSKNFQRRLDAWVNPLTGINYSSRAGSSRWCAKKFYNISRYELDSMYSQDGICKRIIDIYPEEALRAFVDCDIRILEELYRLKLKSKTFEACRDARLFGGSVVVAFVDDGRDLQDELDYTNIDKLIHLKVYDRYQVSWLSTDLVTDHLDEDYGMPLFYTIQNDLENLNLQFKVHKSRIFKFAGDTTTNFSKKANEGWDKSCLISLYQSLKSFGESAGVSAEIIQGYLETVITIPELSYLLTTDDGKSQLDERIEDLNRSKGAFKTIYLSEGETYQKHPTNIHGLPELWDRFGEQISASCSIPVSVLFGRSPAGLNATGKAELDLMNNKIEEYRNNNIKPFFMWIFKILEAQRSFVAEVGNDLDFHWEFHPIVTLDEKKEAETRKLNAEVDMMYINSGAVDAQTVFRQRYHADQGFNNNIMFTKEDLGELEKTMKQAELEQEQLNFQDLELLKDLEKEKLDKEKKMNSDSKDDEEIALIKKEFDKYFLNEITKTLKTEKAKNDE